LKNTKETNKALVTPAVTSHESNSKLALQVAALSKQLKALQSTTKDICPTHEGWKFIDGKCLKCTPCEKCVAAGIPHTWHSSTSKNCPFYVPLKAKLASASLSDIIVDSGATNHLIQNKEINL
jgi:hypothetical protein